MAFYYEEIELPKTQALLAEIREHDDDGYLQYFITDGYRFCLSRSVADDMGVYPGGVLVKLDPEKAARLDEALVDAFGSMAEQLKEDSDYDFYEGGEDDEWFDVGDDDEL